MRGVTKAGIILICCLFCWAVCVALIYITCRKNTSLQTCVYKALNYINKYENFKSIQIQIISK